MFARPGECPLQAWLRAADPSDGATQPARPPAGLQPREGGQARPGPGPDWGPGGRHAED